MKGIDIFCWFFAVAFLGNAAVEIFNPDQAFDLYGPKNKACGFSSYANMKLTAAYNIFVAVLLAYTPTFSHADKVKVMRALFVFGLLVGYFTWEAFGGETDFVYFGAGSSFAAAIGALLFSFNGNSAENAAKKITKKL